jgi:hypothetical protein
MENFAHEDTDVNAAELIRNAEPSTPEESAKTIERAERYEMHPDEYKSMEKELNPEAEIQERVPAQVSTSVQNHMSKSAQHTNLVKDEVGTLEMIGKQAKFIKYNLFEKFKLEEEIFEMENLNRLDPKALKDEDFDYLEKLYSQQQKEIDSFELEGFEKVSGQAAGLVTDMTRSVFNNKALIAGTTALGAAVGGVGAIPALGTAVTVAIAKEAYLKTTVGTFADLRRMKDEKTGEPLNLPRETIDNISTAVGVVAGSLEYFTGKTLTAGLTKLIDPKRLAINSVKNVQLKVAMTALGNAAKTGVVSGAEETSAEIASILGENYARGTADEAGFLNAITATTDQIMNDKATQERLKMTAVVGTVGGGLISGGTSIIAAPKAISNIKKDIKVEETRQLKTKKVNEAIKVLKSQNDFTNVSATTIQTNLKNKSPEQMSDLRKDMFDESGYEGKIFFNENDIATIEAENPELAADLRKLDVTGATEGQTSSGVGLDPHRFLDLVDDNPTLSEYMRMNPEAPNPLESRNFLETLNGIEAERQALFESLGADQKMTPEQELTLKGLNDTVEAAIKENTIETYVEDFDLPPSIESIMPKDQLERYKDAQYRTRFEVSEQITEEFNQREQRIENKVLRANDKILKEQQLRDNKRGLELVEKFKGETRKDFSPLAIDPNSLPLDLKEAYMKDKKLRSRRAFKEGGITLEESAAMAGYESGQAMLKDLANAPTVKELADARKKKISEVRKQVKETRDKSKDARLDELFNETSKLHIREMEIMKSQEWGATKTGIKIATPIIGDVNKQAVDIINKTKVGNVSPKQFNAGERILQKKYLNHILKNEVEQAFISKTKAVLNSELTRESLRARKKINDTKRFIKKLNSKKTRANLEKSGLIKEVDSILELFNLDPTVSKKETNRQNYVQYIKSLADRGEGVIVPESLSDVRQRGSDLTVEQYGKITDRLRNLEHQSKLKNKLLKLDEKRKAAGKLLTEEAVVTEAVLELEEHPTFDPNRKAEDPTNKNSRKFINKMKDKFSVGKAAFTNFKNVLTELDKEHLGGSMYNLLAEPLVRAETFKRERLSNVTKQIKKIADIYGSEKFKAAFNDFVDIKQFEGYEALGFGTMVRSDLWMLLAYTGDSSGRDRIGNFKHKVTGEPMTIETVRAVLDEHLTEQDANLVQNFTNIFKSFEEEAKALHKRTTGVEPTMVKGVPIQHKGKVLDGGYVPMNYLNTTIDEKIDRFLDIHGDIDNSMFGGKDDRKLYSALRAAEQTDQGRLIDRSGSSRELDTDFTNLLQGFEEHIHDVAYREAGMDTLKLAKNQFLKKGMIATVGEAKYETVINGIIETVGKVDNDRTSSVFSKEHRGAFEVYKYFEQGFAINALGFNIKSVAMQPLSLGTATLRMGPKGATYLRKALGQAIKSVGDYEAFFQSAVEINPDLATGRDNIDDTLTTSTYDFIDKTDNAGKFRSVKQWRDKFREVSMMGLQKVDIQLKAAVSLASYSQFVNGDVKNFDQKKLASMTPVQIDIAAKKYVKQISDLALTTSANIDKSAVEKIAIMRLFTRFYTDVRSQLNTGTSQVRKIRNAIKEGDIKGAARDGSALMTIYMMNKMYTDSLYDEETPISELGKVNDFDSLIEWMGDSISYGVKAPISVGVGSVPIARDVQFALESKSRKKSVNNWIDRALSDVAMATLAINDMIHFRSLSKKKEKALVNTMGILTQSPAKKTYPVLKGIMSGAIDISGAAVGFLGGQLAELGENIGQFIEENKDVESQQEFIKDLKQIQKDIVPPQSQSNIVPEDALENIPKSEWNTVDSVTGAAGVYQFTEQRWDEIAEQAPDLDLTDNGRVTKDISQQEKAMKWSLENNAKGLAAYRVDVNIKTLYGAHRFGLDDYAAIELSGNNEKLTNIVENEELFEGFTTVKQVKDFVANKIKTKD